MELECKTCGKEIADGATCYQIRFGEWDEENYDFIADEDEGYYHVGCLPDESAAAPIMAKKLADTVDWLDREIESLFWDDASFIVSMKRELEELRDDLAETLRKIKED